MSYEYILSNPRCPAACIPCHVGKTMPRFVTLPSPLLLPLHRRPRRFAPIAIRQLCLKYTADTEHKMSTLPFPCLASPSSLSCLTLLVVSGDQLYGKCLAFSHFSFDDGSDGAISALLCFTTAKVQGNCAGVLLTCCTTSGWAKEVVVLAIGNGARNNNSRLPRPEKAGGSTA